MTQRNQHRRRSDRRYPQVFRPSQGPRHSPGWTKDAVHRTSRSLPRPLALGRRLRWLSYVCPDSAFLVWVAELRAGLSSGWRGHACQEMGDGHARRWGDMHTKRWGDVHATRWVTCTPRAVLKELQLGASSTLGADSDDGILDFELTLSRALGGHVLHVGGA